MKNICHNFYRKIIFNASALHTRMCRSLPPVDFLPMRWGAYRVSQRSSPSPSNHFLLLFLFRFLQKKNFFVYFFIYNGGWIFLYI